MAINLKYLKNGIITSTGWMVLLAFIFSCGNSPVNPTDNPEPQFLLADDQLPIYEKSIDHATLISREYTREIKESGLVIYRTTCFSCHGDEEQSGSLPNSKKFWEETFKNGNDPYSLYQTMTRGFDQMPPQMHLVPSQKYDVIQFIREEFIRENNPDQYFEINKKYLARLPKGVTAGPSPQPYHPWADLDYGNWLIHCYELADDSDPPKYISKGRAPLPNEDYSDVNFAYKGIAVRLDSGVGGIAKGKAFALFDHDLMRMTGVWTGEGFIDWADILLNDVHNVYPRTVGKRHFENPIKPGWANPANGSFEDPRMRGLDGRPFGPLPRRWAHYKGLYRYNDDVIIRYTVGNANILETWSLESSEGEYVFSRSLSLSKVNMPLKLLVAPDSVSVKLLSERGNLVKENGFYLVNIPPLNSLNLKLVISGMEQSKLDDFSINVAKPETLDQFTKGSPKKYDQGIQSLIIPGNDDDPYAVDVFVLPEPNPWKSRVRLTGIDFIKGGDEAVVCTIDGEVWRIEGILSGEGNATWHRIATGLYQPLGIKVVQDKIYVGCRDQIVILRDLNDDGETDFYESFNSDHQVTEHFHEFAMGLETDDAGNFYYAKSGRHARTSLVSQHGTLIKVSADGLKTEILANGFRAANGICLNPDGSFYVTDQEGFGIL